MLRARLLAAAALAGLAVSASAGAATPAVQLAGQLKANMQVTYDKHKSGFVFTTVTCKIAADRSSAHCQAHFTDRAAHALGVIQVTVTGDASGSAQYRAVSIRCSDSKSGAALKC